MSQNPIVNTNLALSRDLDVEIQLSRPQTEIATDMTLLCFLTPEADFAPDNDRVRYYSSFEALAADAPAGGAMYFAGNAFFSRSTRPQTLAVGRVFESPVPAALVSGDIDFAALAQVQNGAFRLEVNQRPLQLAGLDFTGVTDLSGLAARLEQSLAAKRAQSPDSPAADLRASLKYGGLCLETVQSGDGAGLSYAQSPLPEEESEGAEEPTAPTTPEGAEEPEEPTEPTQTEEQTGQTDNLSDDQSDNQTANQTAEQSEQPSPAQQTDAQTDTQSDELSDNSPTNPDANQQTANPGDAQTINLSDNQFANPAAASVAAFSTTASTTASTTTPLSDVSGLLGLTRAASARLWQGYTPAGLAAEAALVRQASICNGRPIYGWSLDGCWRDTDEQKRFADWIEPQAPAIFCGCTNSASAYTAGVTTNFGTYIQDKGYTRSAAFWHDNEQVYPDVSYLALALSVNYSLSDAAITLKFKELDGIEPAGLTETMLAVLTARNINCYTRVGNNARTVREGTQAAATWYTDTRVNLDNFREELQVEVYNAFLRNPKIPYTAAGQDLLVSAAAKICRKYTRNGVFAPRDVEAPELESGFTTLPAFDITPVPVAYSTASDRAARLAPPIQIVAYEAGAFHKVSIQVDVYN